jgi:CRISPR-associated RAMP protein (TIGR02581 family)
VHKQLMNEAILEIAIRPEGPLLIKAGETGGLDPTHPDMEFVRTLQQVFIPGSSLKGVLRAHAERIVRSLQAEVAAGRGACDPLKRGESCSDRIEKRQGLEPHEKYRQSCFICRLFGNTAIASHVRFADALPVGDVRIEERNGVAIDRVFGSVAHGPFNYEVVTRGTFRTSISFRNFTLPQLALFGLALRDVGEGRVGIGFGKSRGLGRVMIDWGRLTLRYPLAELRAQRPDPAVLSGVGALLNPETCAAYGLAETDSAELPNGMRFASDEWGSALLLAEGGTQVQALFRAALGRWREEVRRG